ncbi:MAG: pentapeptide repeat-containing protein [Rhodospirillales bacterium]
MNKEETLALWQQGKDAWNAWAQQMLAHRAEMEQDGTWAARQGHFVDEDVPENKATAVWMRAAVADFAGQVFDDSADFSGFLFAGSALFYGARFKKYASFNGATFSGNAWFPGAVFSGYVSFIGATFSRNAGFGNEQFISTIGEDSIVIGEPFDGATFSGTAWFDGATFSGNARFDSATFIEDARFVMATFSGDASIRTVTFNGDAEFFGARFIGDAGFQTVTFSGNAPFHGAMFSGDADFHGAMFSGDAEFFGAIFIGDARFCSTTFSRNTHFIHALFLESAGFVQATFKGYTDFARVWFRGLADFSAAQGERAFSLEGASFAEVPNFIQAHFSEAPRLDHVSIPEVGGIARFLLPMLSGIDADPDLSARYRALKRLAIEAHDQARELDYSANELKALRGHPDSLLPCPLNLLRKDKHGKRLPLWPGGTLGTARYWFGLGYEALSNFGRSMVLPLVWWGVATVGFAWAYLAHAVAGVKCAAGGSDSTPWSAALGLSIRKALPFAGIASSEKLSQIYACLYGIHGQAGRLTGLPDRFTPVIPDAVDYLGMGQLVLSILLLFLFLLAVRSHFRIR